MAALERRGGAPASRAGSETRRPSAFWPLAAIAVPPLEALFRYELRGELPAEGPFILAGNHLSELDPLVVGYGVWRLGRAPHFMAKDSLWKIPGLGAALRATGQIPVVRGRGGQASIQAAGERLAEGGGVIVYPEGTLTREPALWPMRGKSGAVRMAAELGVPLIPFAHWGTQAVFGRYATRPTLRFRAPVTMSVGEPMDLSGLRDELHSRSAVQGATDELMRRVSGLLAEVRGGQPPAELYDPERLRARGQRDADSRARHAKPLDSAEHRGA